MEQADLGGTGASGGRAAPRSELKHLQAQVRELERLLGKKTLEAETLKEAIAIARSKKLQLRSRLRGSDGE